MITTKKVLILSGTRADFGKIKSIILSIQEHKKLELEVFVTGMHLDRKYGYTIDEIYKSNIKNIVPFDNSSISKKMEVVFSETIKGLSNHIQKFKPDLIVVHGDRIEALAAAIVGSLNNILVAHIEGGEVSGTIDESIRHAITKFSHLHFVTDVKARKRLTQLGEIKESIYVIGSPDIDLMDPSNLTPLIEVKERYEIGFKKYAIALFHPVITEIEQLEIQINSFCDALIESQLDYIVVFPNNDNGSDTILNAYNKKLVSKRFKIFPSIRFEYFLTLLKDASFIIGNSSSGIREAPYYNVPTIDIGTRQKNRVNLESVITTKYDKKSILQSINKALELDPSAYQIQETLFGNGDSHEQFLNALEDEILWKTNNQKLFQDINFDE